MEEEKQEECFVTPSVILRMSSVSLMDAEQQGEQSKDSVSPSFASASLANTLSCMAHPTCAGASHAQCMDVADADASPAMCVDVPHAPQQEAVMKQELDNTGMPCWAEMVPDALVKIFNHLPLEGVLCTIPCVCRTWRLVSQAAPCWQNVDLSEWGYGKHPKTLERMLLLVVNRSRGCLQGICAPNLKNDAMLRLIADSGSQLQVLRIPDSFVSEECIIELAPKFSSLIYLDISGRFPSRALIESFGKHCPFITRLNLNMRLDASDCKSCDAAALSVAEYMPQLKHLEMAYGLLSHVGLNAILERCTSLEYLDLRGCWHVNMEEATSLKARTRIKVFLCPVVEDDIYDISDDDDDVDDDIEDYDDYIHDYDDFLNDSEGFFDGVDMENIDEDDSWEMDAHEAEI